GRLRNMDWNGRRGTIQVQGPLSERDTVGHRLDAGPLVSRLGCLDRGPQGRRLLNLLQRVLVVAFELVTQESQRREVARIRQTPAIDELDKRPTTRSRPLRPVDPTLVLQEVLAGTDLADRPTLLLARHQSGLATEV